MSRRWRGGQRSAALVARWCPITGSTSGLFSVPFHTNRTRHADDGAGDEAVTHVSRTVPVEWTGRGADAVNELQESIRHLQSARIDADRRFGDAVTAIHAAAQHADERLQGDPSGSRYRSRRTAIDDGSNDRPAADGGVLGGQDQGRAGCDRPGSRSLGHPHGRHRRGAGAL